MDVRCPAKETDNPCGRVDMKRTLIDVLFALLGALSFGLTTAALASPALVANRSFEVAAEAIPEFPTVIAAIMVAGSCFGIYYWMRKRKQFYVRIQT